MVQRARRAKTRSSHEISMSVRHRSRYAGSASFSDTREVQLDLGSIANAYFWHRFYSHQPDLNFDNRWCSRRAVGTALLARARIDGLRLDAVPIVEREAQHENSRRLTPS